MLRAVTTGSDSAPIPITPKGDSGLTPVLDRPLEVDVHDEGGGGVGAGTREV